jgi:cytochrome c oxidase subunit I
VSDLHQPGFGAAQPARAPEPTEPRRAGFIRRYVFSRDHKVIGLQYFFLALSAVLLGTALSALMRVHLVAPQLKLPFFGQIKPEDYLALVTMHGTLMVFFVLTTAPQGAFGNYLLPLQLGAREMAYPTLNMLSFWTTFLAFLVFIAAFFVTGGAPIGGWTAYPPLSAIPSAGPGQGLGMDLWLLSIAIFCIASLLGSINFIATTLNQRTHGMKLMRMPLPCWAWFVTGMMSLLAFGVLLAAGIMLLMDRNLGSSFFVPGGLLVNGKVINHTGGSPLLWQHLFWFFGHPEVYLAILPGMGVVSHIISTFSRKPVFGYKVMAYATVAIGVLGFLIWGHHMFTSGMGPNLSMAFSALTLAIGVPSGVKTFNWLGTMWRGNIRFYTPMLFAVGFVSFFVTGGLSGPILAQPSLDQYVHDTYFVVAHFHLIMGVAAIFGIFAATYFWFPKMFGRMMNEPLGKLHFWLTFLGAYAIFMPMHFLGMAGHPRRYAQMTDLQYLQALVPMQKFITYAAAITIAAQLIFLVNLFWSMKRGKRAADNPWEATTLEWTVSSPPPANNFGEQTPVVNRGAYEFSVPGATRDYVMQNEPA